MKICYLADASIIHSRRWAGWFAAHGHDTLLISTTGARTSIPGVRLINLPGNRNLPVIKWLFWSIRVSRIFRTWQPDVLHAHQLTGAGWIGAASRFHPFIVTIWGSDLYRFPRRSAFHRWLTGWVIHSADHLTVNSKDLAHEAKKQGAHPSKIEIVQWEVDRKLFFSPEKSAFESPNSSITILSLRGCAPIYNQHIILEAFNTLRNVFPNVRLILQDYSSDSGYKEFLNQLITQMALTDSIDWVGPAGSEAEIAMRIRSATLAISVPSSDSAPVSILEAMGCGVPVIASDLPAVRELIRDGENGLLVPPGDSDALSRAMLELLQDSSRLYRFREASLRLMAMRPDHDAQMQKLEQLYKSLILAVETPK